MGVNTCIHLPHDTFVHEVADVIGVLSGLTLVRRTVQAHTWLVVPGVSVQSGSFPQEAEIKITGDLVDGEKTHRVAYCFEDGTFKEFSRFLGPISTPYWVAVGKRLVEFFGGVLVYQDSDPENVLRIAKTRPHYNPDDDAQHSAFEDRLFGILPLTPSEISEMRPYAAYLDD